MESLPQPRPGAEDGIPPPASPGPESGSPPPASPGPASGIPLPASPGTATSGAQWYGGHLVGKTRSRRLHGRLPWAVVGPITILETGFAG